MHTIQHEGWRIHINGDGSGDAILVRDGHGEIASFPGELLRKVIEHCYCDVVEALEYAEESIPSSNGIALGQIRDALARLRP